jgi:ribonucleotide reductase alpha subunit
MAGEFVLVNKHLMRELEALGLWNTTLKNSIIKEGGSVQHIDAIPSDIRDRYKTVWETSMRTVIDMAADRGIYVCQSQSMNLWLADPTYQSMTKMHFYAWEKGLKTGMYYLRRKPAHNPQQFTITPPEECTTCSA